MSELPSRQGRRLARLADEGITQANVLVHEDCKRALDSLRPHLANPRSSEALNTLVSELVDQQPVNVAQVRQLSPFRYPGGKTWLVPVTRRWLTQMPTKPAVLLEPFAGGAMVGLSAAAEGLVDRVELVELDENVAAVWQCALGDDDIAFERLLSSISKFEVSEPAVRAVLDGSEDDLSSRAFRTVVRNRCQRGGILAPGAGLVRTGEGGRGLASRWYPTTLVTRFRAIRQLRHRIGFTHGDAFDAIERHPGAVLFLDPPYTAAGKRAGRRLYAHNELDHERLFEVAANSTGPALLTYDDTEEVRKRAAHYGFITGDVAMKSTHHAVMKELTIFKP